MSSSSSENKNRIFDLCQGFNPSFAAISNNTQRNNWYNIIHNGKVYSSIEEFDVNEMPRSMFMAKPNVVMAYEGTKVINGVDTGIPCITIGVSKKDPNVSPVDMVPPMLPDGVITDIIVVDELHADSTCVDGSGGGCDNHADKHRPLTGGISAMEETGTACTLGLIVKDSTDGSLVALTNNHCAGLLYDPLFDTPTSGSLSVSGLDMLQPSPTDGGTNPTDLYGQVKRAVPMQFGTLGSNMVDGSVSSVGINDAVQSILDINDGPFPFALQSEYSEFDQIYKSARTTGHIPPPVATITNMNASVNVNYGGPGAGDNDKANFTNVMVMGAASRFTQGGDSGSAILVSIGGQFKVAGLNFAGNSTGTIAVACHMENVSSELQIEEWDGSIVVPPTTADVISVNGFCYIDAGPTDEPVTHNDITGTFANCNDCEPAIFSSSSSSLLQSTSSSSSESTQLKSSSSTIDMSSSSTSSTSSTSSLSSEGFSSLSHSSKSSSSTVNMPSSQSSSSTSTQSSSSSSIVTKSSSSSSLSSDFDIVEFYINNSPENLNVNLDSYNGETIINLTWNSMKGADFYRIERKEGFTDWEFLDNQIGSNYNDTTVVPGRYYSYRVSSIGTDSLSGNRVQSLFSTTTSIIFTPVTPSNLDVKLTNGKVRLSWSDNSTYENGFIVKRKYNDGDYDVIYNSRKNHSFFIDSGPFIGGEYSYVVNSFVILSNDTRLDSPDSNEVSIAINDEELNTESENIYITFGEEKSHTVYSGDIFKVIISNPSDVDYFWFIENDNLSIAQFNNYSYLSSIQEGSTKVVVRDTNDNEAILNINIDSRFNFSDPSSPINLLPINKTESSISISWNYIEDDIVDISHFDVYRLSRTGTNNANSLINQNNTSLNRIGSVPNDFSNIFSYTDYGLLLGQSYFYSVVAVNKNGKTSLFLGENFIYPNVIEVSTLNNGLAITPSQVFVEPNSRTILQGVGDDLSGASWKFLINESDGSLEATDSNENIIFNSTDKWIADDIVELDNNGTKATSRIIITKTI